MCLKGIFDYSVWNFGPGFQADRRGYRIVVGSTGNRNSPETHMGPGISRFSRLNLGLVYQILEKFLQVVGFLSGCTNFRADFVPACWRGQRGPTGPLSPPGGAPAPSGGFYGPLKGQRGFAGSTEAIWTRRAPPINWI